MALEVHHLIKRENIWLDHDIKPRFRYRGNEVFYFNFIMKHATDCRTCTGRIRKMDNNFFTLKKNIERDKNESTRT